MNNNKIKHPDFLIVGAAKSGTTALFEMLKTHPSIYVPKIKETCFYSLYNNPNQSIQNYVFRKKPEVLSDYLKLFNQCNTNQIAGEASPSYLYYHDLTIKNIKKLHPCPSKLKIIILLREPIDKILSHYRHVRFQDLDPERLSLKEAILREDERIKNNELLADLFYIQNTKYSEAIKAYKQNFDKVKVYLYDDFIKSQENLMRDVSNFLNISFDDFQKSSFYKKYNKTSKKIIPKLDILVGPQVKLRKYLMMIAPQLGDLLSNILFREYFMEDNLRTKLKDEFLPEINSLENILNRDLTNWKKIYETEIV